MTPKDRFLKACRREPVDRPPVWMMRQAGRYLPEYRKLHEGRTTLEMMKDPETVCEITLQPVQRLGVDAAILYSDILIVPEAMGLKLEFVKDVGPVFDRPVRTGHDVDFLNEKNVSEKCRFVFDAIRRIRKNLPFDFPLLGFAGGPFTVAAYVVGGDGSYDGRRVRQLALEDPALFHRLMEKLTEATIDYLRSQVEAGVDAIQVFDTWAGTLDEKSFQALAQPYESRILQSLREAGVPSILYIKGGKHLFESMIQAGPDVVSIDWNFPLPEARRMAKGRVAIQGNLDPACLLGSISDIEKSVKEMVSDWGKEPGYIINLGHGITPDVPVENAQAFVDEAKKPGVGTI